MYWVSTNPWPGCVGAALVCSALICGMGAVGKGFLSISNHFELLGSGECCRTATAGSRGECNVCCRTNAKLWGHTGCAGCSLAVGLGVPTFAWSPLVFS